MVPALSRPLRVADVPPEGAMVEIEADASERAALAAQNGLEGVDSLQAALAVKPVGDKGLSVRGMVRSSVRQTCVVTLEPFDAALAEEVDLCFFPKGSPLPKTREGEDVSDEIVGGVVDLGALVAEFLALGLDPYPRKPGASFDGHVEDGDAGPVSPFAALKALRGGGGDDE